MIHGDVPVDRFWQLICGCIISARGRLDHVRADRPEENTMFNHKFAPIVISDEQWARMQAHVGKVCPKCHDIISWGFEADSDLCRPCEEDKQKKHAK